MGKPKAAYVTAGLADYAGRLARYGGCALQQVRAAAAKKGRSAAQLRAEEGERLLARLGERDLVWALERRGKAWTSEDWAWGLEQARAQGWARLVLLVGGAEGLAPAVLQRAAVQLSLGAATLPHELAALVGLEQLYRACTIVAGTPYHRG